MDEIRLILDTPLADLMFRPDEKALADELTRQAVAAPAMARLRTVVEFVGKGRPATQAGNVKPADARALSERLGAGEEAVDRVRTIEDLPETAHAFRWAAAAEFLAWRGTKIVAGPSAGDLERDPLAAWFKAAITLLEHGPLDGFRTGWRKSYVELLDAGAAGMLTAIAERGGRVPMSAIEGGAWAQVAEAYGYELGDTRERSHVVMLARALVQQLAGIGVMTREDDDVVLSGLGGLLASVVSMSDADDDDVDLVDIDAESLLTVCAEELEPGEATVHLSAWCQARDAGEAADELTEAMLDDEDPVIWDLGFEALGMLDRAVAEPAVRRLRTHPGLRAPANAWLRRHRAPSGRKR